MIPNELERSLDVVQTMDGWCTHKKAVAMAELIDMSKPALSVELGVFGGRSVVAQALALKFFNVSGCVWGIDPWTRDAALEGDMEEANKAYWSRIDLSAVRDRAFSAIDNLNLWKWVRMLAAKSDDVSDHFRHIDVLHIDGNHSEKTSVRDVELWLPHVKKDGWVWFDDWNWSTIGKAVALVDEKCHMVRQIDNCRLYRVK